MNKQELVAAVAKSTGLPKTQATEAVEAVIATITKQLKSKGEVRLIGFGTFMVSKRAERNGRNPQTGKSMKIPATNVPKFKAGKSLKDAVNK